MILDNSKKHLAFDWLDMHGYEFRWGETTFENYKTKGFIASEPIS